MLTDTFEIHLPSHLRCLGHSRPALRTDFKLQVMNGWELGDAGMLSLLRCGASASLPKSRELSCCTGCTSIRSAFSIGCPAARWHASIHRAEPVWRVWHGLGTRLSSGRVCIQLCWQHWWWPVWRSTSKLSRALWRRRYLWHLKHTDKSAEPQGQGQKVICSSSHGLA